jgi:hypothetical protein
MNILRSLTVIRLLLSKELFNKATRDELRAEVLLFGGYLKVSTVSLLCFRTNTKLASVY